MKASEAYSQGIFNSCSFELQTASTYKVALVDDVNGLQGSFVAVCDDNQVIVAVEADTDMEPIKKGGAPLRLLPPEPPEGGK